MNSVEKVAAALDNVEHVADDPAADNAVRTAATFVGMARAAIDGMLPKDAGELDELLQRGAEWFHSLRSDPPA